ncbi:MULTISPECIES: sigma 54-interacting transcriptional regulator [unclassified Symbiopectobacterium]|uniref:sigma 54-interacting transcriptional regulator n=1 Tax=unclassified Symbiopectobacterium TaxID=2794573 RepID=UPI0022279AEA|nr:MULTISPECIES: sigma 54-interacting transcriptional regulator [unclassified Symbiopectobacterium]MCW2476751.1 sigma 54-interacting transcriptional regulator [Candidatus Symbiopectobacterium sp. NZEC151]MCW2481970.1 sigma 54-interacting transcriptional regulator [Candidatus Symbiopectobacterium sp. NZEC135]
MPNNDIVIFSVSNTITQRISNVLIERNIEIPVYEFHYSDVVDKAQGLINGGTKIIISRGGTAALLRSSVTIPVIEIAHDFHGIYRSLQEAKDRTEKIAVVGFPQFCNVLRHYQTMTGEEFKICQVYNHNDIEHVIKNLAANEYKLVIGGLTVAEMAKKYGLKVIMGDTDNISIEQALNEAFSLLKYINKESMKLSMSYAALNQSREGIMCIDQSGEVININAKGMGLFRCSIGDKIFQKEAYKGIFGSIINEINVKEQLLDIDGDVIHASIKHVTHKQYVYTIISGFKQDSALAASARGGKKSEVKGFCAAYSFSDIVGESAAIREAINRAKVYASHDLPVFIFGATGTGKELFAQSIHNASERKNAPFIAINCAAIPEGILESELFGYVEGAFTNARRGGKAGIFEMAMNGTVFIDEISEAPLSVQIKLLRILQEKQFSRLGGDTLLAVDFRLITASNKPLADLVTSGDFRQDLYYRINVLDLALPALRERTGDVMLIIKDLLFRYGREMAFTDRAVAFLNHYSWPGNVRELHAAIHRLIVLFDKDVVDKEDIHSVCKITAPWQGDGNPVQPSSVKSDDIDLLKKQEKRLISDVITLTEGDRVKASVMLGISQTTLWRKIKAYQLV